MSEPPENARAYVLATAGSNYCTWQAKKPWLPQIGPVKRPYLKLAF
jgi:hypothetical protein